MKLNRRQVIASGAALAGGATLPAYAAYPERDISFILNYNLSGSTYPVSKIFCSQLEKYLGAKIIIEARPGGSGTIGLGMLVRSKPDGYTIGYMGASNVSYQPLVNDKLPYKSIDDIQPLVKLFDMPTLLVVRNDSPWKNFDDFMKAVREKPGQVRVGTPGARTAADMTLYQVNRLGKVQIRNVPFTGGSGESIIAMLGGRIDAMCSYAESVRGHVAAGTMRVIGVFQDKPYYMFPDATPIAAKHFPEATLPATNYIVAPKGIPADILDRLVKGAHTAVTSDEFKTFARNGGMELDPIGPEGIRKEIVRTTDIYIELIKFIDGKTIQSPYKKA